MRTSAPQVITISGHHFKFMEVRFLGDKSHDSSFLDPPIRRFLQPPSSFVSPTFRRQLEGDIQMLLWQTWEKNLKRDEQMIYQGYQVLVSIMPSGGLLMSPSSGQARGSTEKESLNVSDCGSQNSTWLRTGVTKTSHSIHYKAANYESLTANVPKVCQTTYATKK